jgi:hypothetical protein
MDANLIATTYVLFGYALIAAGATLHLLAQHTRWGRV